MSKWTIAKETVATLSEDAQAHGADAAGMLEALISTAIGALAAEKDAAYVKNFIDYEVSSINVQHVDVQRLT
ncbi:MAG: hypothetical protein ISP99_04360 [Pseudomonadales bacterium]|nr:hypothetical protein [Pseudomonadales bacterium]MBL6814333.1 hypothetical protein [Pseudomonadales bacterium]